MANKEDFKRIDDEFDPERCQMIIPSSGQCINKAYPGSEYCLAHGGNKAAQAAEKQALKNYRLQRYNQRLGEARNSDHLKDLRDEVAILRIVLEEKMNAINSTNELILQSGAISDMILKIEKLVTSCQRLEEKTGIMLDKNKVLMMAENIITIVTKHVERPEVIEAIAADFDRIFSEVENEA